MLEKFDLTARDFDSLVITAAVLLVFVSMVWYITHRIRREIKPSGNKRRGQRIFRKALLPLTFLLIVVALSLNVELIFSDEEIIKTSKNVLKILTIFGVAWLSINAVRVGREVIFNRYDISQKDNLKVRKIMTQFRIIERILVFLIVFIAIALVLMTFESIRSIGVSLFASAGVAGIILGLAAQKVIGTVLAGLQIAITQPIRLDDVLVVEGEWGWIEEITLTYVVLRIWDKRRLILPTTYFIEKPFQNWTRNSADILGSVFIYADYEMPVDKLREAFHEIVEKTPHWDRNVAVMQVTDATESTVEIRALMSAADSPTAWDLRVHVREKLIQFLRENYSEHLPRTRVSMEKNK
jgi:small-conductance mechanosensitive channel